jgi:hypothetical protein
MKTISKINPRLGVLLLFIVAVALLRFANSAQANPFSNFTPLGAMGLFGGAYISSRWKAYGFPIVTLFISDLAINTFVYQGKYGLLHSSWYYVYGGFALIVFMGRYFLQKIHFIRLTTTGIGATLLYWLVVDFGVFVAGCTNISTGQVMDHSLGSLLTCYAQGIPFVKNFLISTILYSFLMFGAFEWLQSRVPMLKVA